MSLIPKRYNKGIVLKGETADLSDNLEGSIFQNSSQFRLKTYIEGAVRQIVTDSQSQILTNKTIDAINNTISNIQTLNLLAGTLNTSTTLSGASNTQLPSALAVKTYIDDKTAAQNEASEISFNPVGTISAVTVQAMGQELDGDIQSHITSITGAHAASAISNSPLGNLAATTVQGALNELQTDADTISTSLSGHISASTNVHGLAASSSVVGTTDSQTLTHKTLSGASIQAPIRSDLKQDTKANLTTYALTATNGQTAYATDTKEYLAIKDGALVSFKIETETSFNISNNQSSAANVAGLVFNGVSVRGFILEYSIYRQTATAASGVAQIGQLRGVFNTQSNSWFISDDFSGQNSGVTFSITSAGQIQYTSSNIAGTDYAGTMQYTIRKTFNI